MGLMVSEKSTLRTNSFFTIDADNFNLSLVLHAEVTCGFFWFHCHAWLTWHGLSAHHAWIQWGWKSFKFLTDFLWWGCICNTTLHFELFCHSEKTEVLWEVCSFFFPLNWSPIKYKRGQILKITYSLSSGQKKVCDPTHPLSMFYKQAVQ